MFCLIPLKLSSILNLPLTFSALRTLRNLSLYFYNYLTLRKATALLAQQSKNEESNKGKKLKKLEG
jgi:hypothetical protein